MIRIVSLCGELMTSAVSLASPPAISQEVHPNVLLIAIDDLGDWVGCLAGHPQIRTPNMDRLAARGSHLTNRYGQAPICRDLRR